MFDLGPEKILVVLLIAVVFLGPERLPEMARRIGSAVRQVRGLQDTVQSEIQAALTSAPEPTRPHTVGEPPESRTFT